MVLSVIRVEKEKQVLEKVSSLIQNWLKKHPDASGARAAYYYEADPTKKICIDIETSDGYIHKLNYEKLLNFAALHDNKYITDMELMSCKV